MYTARKDAASQYPTDHAGFREQIISVVLQTLHCFKLHLTPLDIVIEILCAKGKYEEVRHDMLRPRSIARFFDALAACDTNRDFLRHNVALDVIMKRVDTETKSVVSRLGDHLQHPILLAHAEIRSETTVAPFLRAILNQVNKSMILGQQTSEPIQVGGKDPLVVGDSSEESALHVTDTEEAEVPGNVVQDSSTVSAFSRESTATVEAMEYDDLQPFIPPESRSSTVDVEDAPNAPYHNSGAMDECVARLIGGDYECPPGVSPSPITTEPVQLPKAVCDVQPPRSSPIEAEGGGPKITSFISQDHDDSYERGSKGERDSLSSATICSSSDDVFAVTLFASVAESLSSVPQVSHKDDSPLQQAEPITSHDPCHAEDRLLDGHTAQNAPFSISDSLRPHACTLCSKRFKAARSLKDHLNLHSGAKPYKCTQPGCFNKFSHYGTFAAHRRAHAEESDASRSPSLLHSPSEPPGAENDAKTPDTVNSGSSEPSSKRLSHASSPLASPRKTATTKSPAERPRKTVTPIATQKRKLHVTEPAFQRKVILKLPMSSKSLESVS